MREISHTYEVKSPNYEILDSRTKLAAQHRWIVNSNFKHGIIQPWKVERSLLLFHSAGDCCFHPTVPHDSLSHNYF